MPGWTRIFSSAPRNRLLCIVTFTVSGAVACSGDNITCAANVVVASPAVVITSVTNKQTGTPIAHFTISNFIVAGQVFPASGVVSGVLGTNATVMNGALACSGSCGFGGVEGTYTFTVSATGRPDTSVTVAAKYASSIGQGCSRELKDGTPVAVTL